MKYLKIYESWDSETPWDKERREKEEAKIAELNKYTINGLKVIDTESFESIGSGFVLENKDVILIEWYGADRNYYDRIIYYKYDDGGYDEETYQDAGSEWDYTYTYKKYKEGDFLPVFKTKADAQTFLHLFKLEYSKYEGYKNITIKLKYIVTPDKKDPVKIDVKESDFQRFMNKKFILRKYRYTGNDVNYEIKEIDFDNRNTDTVHVIFTLENDLNEHVYISTRLMISFFICYNEIGEISKFEPRLTEYQGFGDGSNWKFSEYPQLVAFAKEVKKIFTSGVSEPKLKPPIKKRL